MITDLFHETACKVCGGRAFQRLDVLQSDYGTDFLCECLGCGSLFVKVYERRGVQGG